MSAAQRTADLSRPGGCRQTRGWGGLGGEEDVGVRAREKER